MPLNCMPITTGAQEIQGLLYFSCPKSLTFHAKIKGQPCTES